MGRQPAAGAADEPRRGPRRCRRPSWLRTLRAAYADDVPGRDLIEHTSADQLQVLGSLQIMPQRPHWHRGRMVLVGDSAHAPSNSSGQGASLAIESAVQLARCLRDLPDVATAFAAYERLRRPRVETDRRPRGRESQPRQGPGRGGPAGSCRC